MNLDDVSMPFVSREDSESTFVEYTDDGLCLPAGPIGQLKETTANFLTEPSVEIFIASVVLLLFTRNIIFSFLFLFCSAIIHTTF